MKNMRFFGLLLAGLAVLVSGCMTSQMIMPPLSLPENSGLEQPSVVGMSRAQDARPDQSGGSIGGVKIVIGSDLGQYLETSLKQALNGKGIQVVEAPNPEEVKAGKASGAGHQVIVPILKAANISTFDSVMAPAVADLSITLKVYDRENKVVFAKSFAGDESKRLGFTAGGKKQGLVMARAVEKTVQKILADPEFLNSLGPAHKEAE